MGRSQVQRNKTHGRPGQGRGRGGRDSGRGRHKQGSDNVTKLCDNSFRYDNRTVTSDNYQDIDYDGLLDDINFSGDYTSLEYRIDGGDVEDDLFGITTNNDDTAKDNSHDYLHIDVTGLSKCLEQLPIHERLDLPMHLGKHLEDIYGDVPKKTLAELREDAKITSVSIETSIALAVDDLNSGSVTQNGSETQRKVGADDDEEDLEAWLDNIIS
ncbi:hypothetical protein HJC23_007371 [Cyclotella cryptica]|uniref:Uncharacterized protein n=1 Tax=Cyclotella cryptica TaxID=29204 RepID=A0ABD3Q3T6_9STRA|eukprot:CCRYP_008687-RA/>CCRYP_008687-RA protein AED:0.06 eAED:0.06 QI:92/1/1/1/0/0/3/404/212